MVDQNGSRRVYQSATPPPGRVGRKAPLKPPYVSSTYEPMAQPDIAEHGKRIWRLELAFCAGFLALLAVIGGLYLYVGEKTEKLDTRLGNIEVTAGRLDERTSDIGRRLDGMDKKLDAISAKLDKK